MTPTQIKVFRGFSKGNYYQLSASEAGDPDIQQLFDKGYVESYWGGGVMWHLTRKGREKAVELGLREHADQFVFDAATGKMERIS